MKIEDRKTAAAIELRQQQQPTAGSGDARAASAKAQAPAARVELSSRSRELHAALQSANAHPDVRQEKVEDARQRIADGTYHVDPERIARRMLDRRA
jgi:negative regulator of flagellin synthesis FlgM